jgi:urease accessory protein
MNAVIPSSKDRAPPSSWPARLSLEFASAEGTTRLVHREHEGPLRVQRPFYPEGNGTSHVYVLHPPGGVVGGDHLEVRVSTRDQARAVVTNPAATKLYRSDGRVAKVRQSLSVASGSLLEWLPQETIVFDGANAELTTQVHLDGTSQFLGWDVLCLGRPAAKEKFSTGRLIQSLEVWRDALPLYLERAEFGEGAALLGAEWGLGGAPVLGTMWIATDILGVLELGRQCISAVADAGPRAAATELDGVTVIRYVGPSVRDCWALFVAVWAAVRPLLSGTSASVPRIWNC